MFDCILRENKKSGGIKGVNVIKGIKDFSAAAIFFQ